MLLDLIAPYQANRIASDPLPQGSAPRVSSTSFTLKRSAISASARRWDHKLNTETSQRASSTLKASSQVRDPSKTISLGTARPAAQYYPWQSIEIQASDAHNLSGEDIPPVLRNTCSKGEQGYDLGLVLNYGYSAGSPQLLRFFTEHTEMIHSPRYQDWETALTCGTTSAIDILLQMLCDRGDTIVAEKFTYPGTIEASKARGIKMLGIGMDEQGMLPEELDSSLRTWDCTKGRKPSVLIIIPSGQNPTGRTQSLERRQEIYEMAERHDLLVIEDDPYYFVQFSESECVDQSIVPCEQFLQSLPPSYLSLDTSGRVVRLDGTSKILAPGLRCGWITGCSQLVQKFVEHSELSTVAPSGPSQALLYKLLDESWGHYGFFKWLDSLSFQFQQRRDTLIAACHRLLPLGLCQWTTPSAGMFLWIKVDFRKHPYACANEGLIDDHIVALDIEDRIYQLARKQGVVITKGSWFAACLDDVRDVCFRLTFAAAGDEELSDAVARLARTMCIEFNHN